MRWPPHAEARTEGRPLVLDVVACPHDGTLLPVEARVEHMTLPEGDAVMLIVTEADAPRRVSRRPR